MTEQQAEQAGAQAPENGPGAPQGGAQPPEGTEAAPEGTEAQSGQESANQEAARWRTQLREVEGERDALTARVEAMQRRDVDLASLLRARA